MTTTTTLTHTDIATVLTSAVTDGTPDSGASQWLTTERESGYLVGIPSLSLTFGSAAMVDPVAVEAWVRLIVESTTVLRESTLPNMGPVTVGSWVNPDTGSVHFDASSWHDNVAAAGIASKHRGEHSFYDIADARCVRTGVAS